MNAYPSTFAAITETLRSIQRSISYPVLGDLGPEYRMAIMLHLSPMATLATRLDVARPVVVSKLNLERQRAKAKHWTLDINRLIALRQLLDAIDAKMGEF